MLGKTINRQWQAPLQKGHSRLTLRLVNLLFASVFCITASSTFAGEIEDYISQYKPQIEPLHGIHVTEQNVTVLVTSTGCTQKQDFIVVLQKSQPPVATFIRLKPDFCKAASHLVHIRFSPEEVGAKEFTVANPFGPSPRY